MGGFEEYAYRAQLLLSPSDDLSFLFNMHGREMSNGTAAIFRANVLGPGSDGFNSNYDRDSVTFDEGGNNPQEASGLGASLKIDWTFGKQRHAHLGLRLGVDGRQEQGDIDGGSGRWISVPRLTSGATDCCPPGHAVTWPDLHSILLRYAGRHRRLSISTRRKFASPSRRPTRCSGREASIYFDSKFHVTTFPFFVPPTTVEHKNTAWAAFAHVSVDVTDAWNITGGVR